jgi:hypothetical protein
MFWLLPAHALAEGMDLNPLFTGATSFRPAGDGGALKLFQQAGIPLVHGWLVDPESPDAAPILSRAQDYDTAVTYIVDADYTAKGQLVTDDSSDAIAGPSKTPTANWTPEERSKIEDGARRSISSPFTYLFIPQRWPSVNSSTARSRSSPTTGSFTS